ncbi:peptidylprolyl isomerase [Erythrobacter sp. Alg231-14]|uniref:peptidylprolyl isomerase n=1 Tax=Erythrobacter sp. Alg231-14 TaxID=1922225 RepID=UPI00307C57F1
MKKLALGLAALTIPAIALAQAETEDPASADQPATTFAQDEPAAAPSPNEIVNGAPAEEWITIAAEDLLVMTLAPDSAGNERTVILQLMPAPFSQGWVENIRTLARAQWYDGVSVNRVQDNYVVQWGDPGHDNPESGEAETKALPEGLNVMGEEDYSITAEALGEASINQNNIEEIRAHTPANVLLYASDAALQSILSNPASTEIERREAMTTYLELTRGVSAAAELSPSELANILIRSTQTTTAPEGFHQRDSQTEWVEFWRGWPLGNYEIGPWRNKNDEVVEAPRIPRAEAYEQGMWRDVQESRFWPVHCYGMVGVGRNYSPDTGSGAELYTVIGHAPRHLDRNIALVGRIISGMEHLSSMTRGTGALGFYTEDEAHLRTPIQSIRVASDLAKDDQPRFEYLSTDGATFAAYAEARANRRDPFFIVPAGGADICNIPVPVRAVEDAEAE